DPAIGNPLADPTSTTSYVATVTDANGCLANGSVTITVNNPPVLIPSLTNVSCYGRSDGSASVTASGSSPFTYLWSNGATTSSLSGLNAGTYSVSVTDKYNCVSGHALNVTEPPPIVLNFKRDYYLCEEAGGVMLVASGGTTYLWSPGADLDDSTIATPFTNP